MIKRVFRESENLGFNATKKKKKKKESLNILAYIASLVGYFLTV